MVPLSRRALVRCLSGWALAAGGIGRGSAAVPEALDAGPVAAPSPTRPDAPFLDGTYAVAAPISVTQQTRWWGLGREITKLQATRSIPALFYSGSGSSGLVFEDMTFDANSKATTSCVQLNGGAYRTVIFRRCRFTGTVGAWQLLIGFAAGKPQSPGSRKSNRINLSQDILIEDCIFDTHTTTTLEQAIIVNAENVTIRNCVFRNNRTKTFSLLIYGFCRNVLIEGCTFSSAARAQLGIQQSDRVTVRNCRFLSQAPDLVRPINIINCADVVIEGCIGDFYTSGASGPVFVGVFNYQGARFESGNYAALYQGTYRLLLRDNAVEGVYALLQAPFQQQSDKNFVFQDISIDGGAVGACVGVPVIVGGYRVSGGQDEGISNIAVRNLVVMDRAAGAPAIRIEGRSHANRVNHVVIEGVRVRETAVPAIQVREANDVTIKQYVTNAAADLGSARRRGPASGAAPAVPPSTPSPGAGLATPPPP